MKKFLIDDWKNVLKKSLSVWFAAASAAFGLLEQNHEQVIQLLDVLKPHIDTGTFGSISTALAVLAVLGRIKYQGGMHQKELK